MIESNYVLSEFWKTIFKQKLDLCNNKNNIDHFEELSCIKKKYNTYENFVKYFIEITVNYGTNLYFDKIEYISVFDDETIRNNVINTKNKYEEIKRAIDTFFLIIEMSGKYPGYTLFSELFKYLSTLVSKSYNLVNYNEFLNEFIKMTLDRTNIEIERKDLKKRRNMENIHFLIKQNYLDVINENTNLYNFSDIEDDIDYSYNPILKSTRKGVLSWEDDIIATLDDRFSTMEYGFTINKNDVAISMALYISYLTNACCNIDVTDIDMRKIVLATLGNIDGYLMLKTDDLNLITIALSQEPDHVVQSCVFNMRYAGKKLMKDFLRNIKIVLKEKNISDNIVANILNISYMDIFEDEQVEPLASIIANNSETYNKNKIYCGKSECENNSIVPLILYMFYYIKYRKEKISKVREYYINKNQESPIDIDVKFCYLVEVNPSQKLNKMASLIKERMAENNEDITHCMEYLNTQVHNDKILIEFLSLVDSILNNTENLLSNSGNTSEFVYYYKQIDICIKSFNKYENFLKQKEEEISGFGDMKNLEFNAVKNESIAFLSKLQSYYDKAYEGCEQLEINNINKFHFLMYYPFLDIKDGNITNLKKDFKDFWDKEELKLMKNEIKLNYIAKFSHLDTFKSFIYEVKRNMNLQGIDFFEDETNFLCVKEAIETIYKNENIVFSSYYNENDNDLRALLLPNKINTVYTTFSDDYYKEILKTEDKKIFSSSYEYINIFEALEKNNVISLLYNILKDINFKKITNFEYIALIIFKVWCTLKRSLGLTMYFDDGPINTFDDGEEIEDFESYDGLIFNNCSISVYPQVSFEITEDEKQIEVFFKEAPNNRLIEVMLSLGFKYSNNNNKYWQGKNTQKNIEVLEIIGNIVFTNDKEELQILYNQLDELLTSIF